MTSEQTNIDNLQTDSGSFSTRLTTEESNVDSLQTDSGSFSTRITTEEANVNTLQSTMTSEQTNIDNLQTDSGSFSTRTTTLETTSSVLSGTGTIQGVGTTNNVQFNHITASGNISGSSTSTGSFGSIHTAGNVGIGTTSPVLSSTIYKGLHIHQPTAGAYGSQLHLTTAAVGSGAGDGVALISYSTEGYLINQESGNFHFYTNGTEVLQMQSDGNATFGGDVYANGTVSVEGNGLMAGGDVWASARQIMYGSASGTYIKSIDNDATDGIKFMNYAGTQIVTILDGGNVGIGTTSPDYKLQVDGTIAPESDDDANLGTASLRWADVFAVQTTTGGIFESGLKTKSIGENPTGTIVVWQEDKLIPCDKNEDELVMGVIKKGKDEPIVLGAEPVLVTGKVQVGDYIVTSNKIGHGKSVKRGYLLKKDLFGKVIAQALESASGDSSLIRCMIRKM